MADAEKTDPWAAYLAVILRLGSQIANRPFLIVTILFVAGVGLTALPSLRFGAPLPQIHDEFGNLFLGQTFADGRLTNDPPPGPLEFFETYHHLLSPRYISKFPPGPGLMYALGILLGNAIIGVWIVNGLWTLAIYWMLRGVAKPSWAALGALAGILSYGAFSYFGYSYWGGSLLALGGTLTFGGALRLWRRRGSPVQATLLAGLGCAVMALTRPLDGFIFALFPAAVIFWSVWQRRAWKPALAFVAPAAIGVGLLLGYNVATTGSATKFAHRLYDETYVPGLVLFVWETPKPIAPNTPAYLANYQRYYSDTLGANPLTWSLQLSNALYSASQQQQFIFPIWILPAVFLALLAAIKVRDRPARFALASVGFLLIPLLILRFYQMPHYAAAWTAPALLLLIQGVRRLRAGFYAPTWVIALAIGLWPAMTVLDYVQHHLNQWVVFPWVVDRVMVESQLIDRFEQTHRPQLVEIIYPPNHITHTEWVFNSPDIKEQAVLWARSLGPEREAELFNAFPGYEHWRLQTDNDGRLVRAELVDDAAADKTSNLPKVLLPTKM